MAKPASGYGQREWEKRKNRCSNNERLGCVMEVNGIKRTGKRTIRTGILRHVPTDFSQSREMLTWRGVLLPCPLDFKSEHGWSDWPLRSGYRTPTLLEVSPPLFHLHTSRFVTVLGSIFVFATSS